MAVCFCSLAKRQHAQVGQLVGSGESGEPCSWSSGSSGRVVPVIRGSVVPTVLWFLLPSCSPRIPFQSWIRVAFHTGQDPWAHVLSCRGKRESRSIAGRHLSLQFEFQGSCPGERGGGQNLLHSACQALVARSLVSVCQNGSEWLCQSCRIVAGSAGLLVVLVPGRFPNSQFCPSTDPVLFNCVPARF